MDTKLIEYILTIAETKSIAKSAEELFLTQSALNQQLLKLEKELGAPLFVRTRNHWELTDVGTLYVESSKKMLEIKKDTYSRIEDMAKRWKGTVTVGLTPERGIQMFTSIYPEIHAQYPETIFQPYEADVETQIKLLDSGQLDFGFHTIFEHKYKHIVYRHILYEPFYLCVPRSHPLAYKDKRTPENYPEISLTEFKNDLFTLVLSLTASLQKPASSQNCCLNPSACVPCSAWQQMGNAAPSSLAITLWKMTMSPTSPWDRNPTGSSPLLMPKTITSTLPWKLSSAWPLTTGWHIPISNTDFQSKRAKPLFFRRLRPLIIQIPYSYANGFSVG